MGVFISNKWEVTIYEIGYSILIEPSLISLTNVLSSILAG